MCLLQQVGLTEFIHAAAEAVFQVQDPLLQLLVVVGSHLLLDGHQHRGQVADLLLELSDELCVCFVLLQDRDQWLQRLHLSFQLLRKAPWIDYCKGDWPHTQFLIFLLLLFSAPILFV